MEKTKVRAESGKQEVRITREFELPVALLFRAHTDPEIVEQWMSNEYATLKVLKLDGRQHGGWQFESRDPAGNVVFRANGTIHEWIADEKFTRTFEMENAPFGVQLEFLEFEALDEDHSRLSMHILYRSVEDRDQMLKMGMGAGMAKAHDRLQDVANRLKA